MKKIFKVLGIIALVAVIGFSFFACGDDSGGNGNGNGNGTTTPVAPTITTTSLPNGTVGTAYSQTLTATGNTPITWSRESGTLPTGLTLSNAGVIAGTPSASGTSNFTVKATNSIGNITKQLSITIAAGSTIPSGPQWTAVSNSTFGTSGITAITYDNGKFVAGGSEGKIATSTDGTTWTAVGTGYLFDYTYNGTTYTATINAIAYGDGFYPLLP